MTPEELLSDLIVTIPELIIIFILIKFILIPFNKNVITKIINYNQVVGMILIVIITAITYNLLGLPYKYLENNPTLTMKAAIYSYPPPTTFDIKTIPIPGYTNNEVLVKVMSTSINPVDYKVSKARVPIIRWLVNHVPVLDFSGIVVGVGSSKACQHFKINDSVYGLSVRGSLSEFTTAFCGMIGKKPKQLSYSEVASYPTVAVGYESLKHILHLEKSIDEQKKLNKDVNVLVIGASGGCGLFASNLIKSAGANIISISSKKNEKIVKANGATTTLFYDEKDFKLKLNEFKDKIDIVYDTVSSFEDYDYYNEVLPLLKDKSNKSRRYQGINGLYADWIKKMVKIFTLNNVDIQKQAFDLVIFNLDTKDYENLAKIGARNDVNLVGNNKKIFSLEKKDVNEAFKLLKSRRTVGKIVFEL